MPKFMKNINIIGRCAGMFRSEKLKETGLGACHHSYILAVCRRPGISRDELAREICINKSNVTRHLAALEESGYVERRQSGADKRVTLVFPTEKALAILPTVRAVIREWNEFLTEGMDEEELERFAATLSRIAERAREYSEREENN
jgi:DNA-binding MarR family transcriptional regulator